MIIYIEKIQTDLGTFACEL